MFLHNIRARQPWMLLEMMVPSYSLSSFRCVSKSMKFIHTSAYNNGSPPLWLIQQHGSWGHKQWRWALCQSSPTDSNQQHSHEKPLHASRFKCWGSICSTPVWTQQLCRTVWVLGERMMLLPVSSLSRNTWLTTTMMATSAMILWQADSRKLKSPTDLLNLTNAGSVFGKGCCQWAKWRLQSLDCAGEA